MICVKSWPFFHFFILGKTGQENVFHDILDSKTALLDYKNIKLKKSKKWDFSKGVSPCFLLNFFPCFCFRQNTPGKCVLRYSRKKKRLCRL